MQKALLFAGVALIIIGLAWPLIARLGLGSLPGDLSWKGEGWSVHVPLASMILISLALTLAINILPRLFR